jgi:diguanylate cyclase (GGDEF)-like protein
MNTATMNGTAATDGMHAVMYKGFFAGIGLYIGCITLAAVPVFTPVLSMEALSQMIGVAVIASLLVATCLLTGLDRRMQDPGAAFLQALFGILICAGLYSALIEVPRPQVMLMALLWVALELPRLGSKRVLALVAAYQAIYFGVNSYSLRDAANPLHADTVYILLVSLVFTGFLYMRARDYEKVRKQSDQQLAELEEAADRIHTFTVQDSETTALKYAYFEGQLNREKGRVDRYGGTFSVGLIEIDGYAELSTRLGETATGQLMREFTNRAIKLIRSMDTMGVWTDDYHPLGRISAGRFGLLLPVTGFDGALKCAERLHAAMDFKSIRTNAGVVGITLSIGVTEYRKDESVAEVMQLADQALGQAKRHNGNDFRGLKRAA